MQIPHVRLPAWVTLITAPRQELEDRFPEVGVLLAVFPSETRLVRAFFAAGMVMCLAGAGMMVWWLEQRSLHWTYAVAAGMAMLIGIVWLSQAIRYKTRKITLGKHGMIQQEFGHTQSWLWSDIVERRFILQTNAPHRLALLRYDGQTILLEDRYQSAEALIDQVSRNTFLPVYSQVRQDYLAGEWVDFGKLRLHRNEGWMTGKRQFAWQPVQRLVLTPDSLELRLQNSKPVCIKLNDLTDVDVLLALVEARRGLQVERTY